MTAPISLIARCRILAQIETDIRALRDAIDWMRCENQRQPDDDERNALTCFQHTGEWATACAPCRENKARMSEITRQKQARRRAIASICKWVNENGQQHEHGVTR